VTHSTPVFLLAGGLGTRISSVYKDTPKCLIDVHGQPFISYVLNNIKKFGFQRVVLLVGHLAQPIIDYVQDGSAFGLTVQYSLDGDALMGTGGSIKKALTFAEKDFVVSYADSYLEYNWTPILNHYFSIGSKSLVSVYKNVDASDKSNIIFEQGKVTDYRKKGQTPAHTHIDWGVSVFSKDTFMPYPDGAWDISVYLLDRIAKSQLDGFVVPEKYFEIGTPQSLELLRQHLRDKQAPMKQANG
jgi:NDP-sugar pyrophosphorylase family protein